MVKSAVGNIDTYTGDIRSHLYSINTDPLAPQFNEEGDITSPYITLTYACMQCHNGQLASEKDMETLQDMADGYHTKFPPTPTPEPSPTPEPTATPTAEASS